MAGLTADFIEATRKDQYKFEADGWKEKPTVHDKICMVVPGAEGCGHKATQRLFPIGMTRHTVENQNYNFRSAMQGWTTYVKYHDYSDGRSYSAKAIKDTVKLKDMIKDDSKQWGRDRRVEREKLVSRIFNRGGDLLGDFVFNGSFEGETQASGDLPYDSKPAFNLIGNLRTTKGGQTYYNSIVAAYPSSGDITPSQFALVYNLMTSVNNRSEMGDVESNKPDTVLTKPGADHFAMQRILTSEKLAGGDLNDKNPYQGLIKNIYDWDYLTESAYFVGQAKSETLQFHEKGVPEMRFFRNENNGGYLASIVDSFGVWVKPLFWRTWTRAGGTSA